MASCVISRSAAKLALPKVCQRADCQIQKQRSTHVDLSIRLHHLQKMAMVSSARSVTTLTETLLAQVPEKQKKMAELKKNHGDHVYVEIESKCFLLRTQLLLNLYQSILTRCFLPLLKYKILYYTKRRTVSVK
jgi:hypothetical protein